MDKGLQRSHPAFLHRFIFLSPQITLLSVIGGLLLLAMIGLGGGIGVQAQANQDSIGFTYSTVNRPFSQLNREVLLTLVYVEGTQHEVDLQAFQQKRDVLTSRWNVIYWEPVQTAFSPEILQITAEMESNWIDLQALFDQWQTAPDDVTVRSALVQQLQDLDKLVFQGDVAYQELRGQVVIEANQASEKTLLVLGVIVFLLAGFIVATALSIRRYIKAQKEAEQRTRVALAAEAAAVESSHFKDQFLAVMSHELRTPLNAIMGFLGILSMSGQMDERETHMVQRSRANAERLLNLINDILDISKIESGRFELVPTAVDLRALVGLWQFQIDVLAKQKGVNFVVEIDPSLPDKVSIDDGALTKIATNLLSNAIKFTEKGEVSLKLRRQTDQWILEVKDTGIGIPAHMHETIFESFRQVDNSFKRAYGGTGLGLSIVRNLVKAMGGSIRLQSTVGDGSQFTVTLPLIIVTDKPALVMAEAR